MRNTPPSRTLHLISRLDGYGGARMLRYLAAHEAAAGRRPVVVALAAVRFVVDELRAAGVQVHLLAARWALDPFALRRLRRLRRRIAADLVYAWDAAAHRYAILSGRREPLVVEFRASDCTPGWMMRLAGQSFASMPLGVPPAQTPRCERSTALAEFGWDADSRVIAVAGPLVRRKQIDEAIWAYELVRMIRPHARLVVFGDGPDRARLERFAASVSEPGCVCFAGYRADLADLLPHTDVYWQLDPSPSTPHALLEAMAGALPAVVSDVPAHREVVAPYETGCVAPFHSRTDVARATDALLGDKALAERLGRNASRFVARHFPLQDALLTWDQLNSSPPIPRPPVTQSAEMP
jgi:glycosyltransferase involved in cell wall biosynthesis